MDFEFHPAWQLAEEKYGDAILSRFPMRLVKVGELPAATTGRERRGAIWVEIELPLGPPVQVINTHLSLYPGEQLLQAQALLSDGWVDEAWERGPVILAGDFNARPTSRSFQLLAGRLQHAGSPSCPSAVWQSASGRATWPSLQPLVRIDHIFSSFGDFQLRGLHVVESTRALMASDHLPLVAEFELVDREWPTSQRRDWNRHEQAAFKRFA